MPTTITCDGGCGATEDLKKIGLGRPLHYCAACAEAVEAFRQARSDLHTAVARKWRFGLEALETNWKAEHPNGVLPDA